MIDALTNTKKVNYPVQIEIKTWVNSFVLTKSEAFLKYCRAVSLFWGIYSLPSEYIWKRTEGVTSLRNQKCDAPPQTQVQCSAPPSVKTALPNHWLYLFWIQFVASLCSPTRWLLLPRSHTVWATYLECLQTEKWNRWIKRQNDLIKLKCLLL